MPSKRTSSSSASSSPVVLDDATKYILYKIWSVDITRSQETIAIDAAKILDLPQHTELLHHTGRAYIQAHNANIPLATHLRDELDLLSDHRPTAVVMAELIPTMSRIEQHARENRLARDAASWRSYIEYVLLLCYAARRNRGAYNTWNDFAGIGLVSRQDRMIDAKMLFYGYRAEGKGKSHASLLNVIERIKKRVPEENLGKWEEKYGKRIQETLEDIMRRTVD
jgi:hypothetical protein